MTLVGVLAGVLTTACWLPQVLRSWRTRSTDDLSWAYLGTLSAGVGLWLVYGVLSAQLPVVLANAATGVALVALIGLKTRHGREAAVQRRLAG
jgi:MtN3 and saliva related transmembrane protein